MLPPKEQAKIFFLCLLRTTAALSYPDRHSISSKVASVFASRHYTSSSSSSPTTTTTTVAASHSNSQNHYSSSAFLEGHIVLRLATRSDVPKIQRCNLATLPENYSNQFYSSHLRQWPDLALVAEHIPPGYELEYQHRYYNNNNHDNNPNQKNPLSIDSTDTIMTGKKKINILEPYNPNAEKEFDIVGYVLGKVEEIPSVLSSSTSSSSQDTRTMDYTSPSMEMNTPTTIRQQRSRVHGGRMKQQLDDDDEADLVRYLQQQQQQQKNKQTEILGHVTSLAVLEPFRRCGLAGQLMKQLHVHMKYQYRASGVGLNVRIGNHAARKLYVEKLGYHVEEVLDSYYQDGEDAFFMKKDLWSMDDDNDDDEKTIMEEMKKIKKDKTRKSSMTTHEDLYESILEDDVSTSYSTTKLQQQQQQVSSEGTGGSSSNSGSSKIKASSVFRRLVQPWWNNSNGRESINTNIKNIWEYGPEEYQLPRYIRLSNPSEESKPLKLESAKIETIIDSASNSRVSSTADSIDLIKTNSLSQKKVVASSI